MKFIKHQKSFKKAEDLLGFFLHERQFKSRHIHHALESDYNGHVFRGQSYSQWPLLPSVFRQGDPLQHYTPQPPSIYKPEDRVRYIGMHLHAELRSVMLFLQNADKVGLETPVDYRMMLGYAELIGDALNERQVDFSRPFPSPEFFGSVALAQHHGVPTRFLDWTESPLIAAYFAAYSVVFDSKNCAVPEPKERFLSVVYFDPGELERNQIPLEIVLAPRAQNKFLLAQKGVFTNFTQANSFYHNNGRWPTLEDIFASSTEHQNLYVVRLPHAEAIHLLRLLHGLGISRQTVMPSLTNCASAYSYASTIFKRLE